MELRNNRRNYRKQENFAEVDRVSMSFKYHQKVFLSSYCTIGICATVINIKDKLSSIENLNLKINMGQEKLWFNENFKLNVCKVIRLSRHGNGLIIDVGGIHQQKRTGNQAHFPLHQVRIREMLEKNNGSQKTKGHQSIVIITLTVIN